jgi:methylated-DNA-[protein]-cysteine S-methyltransferase
MQQKTCVFETAAGFCAIAWSEAGIVGFALPAQSADAAARRLGRRLPGARAAEPTPPVAEAIAAVRRYFAGEPTDFARFPLDLAGQDPFAAGVYALARRLGWGETTTYGALARGLGAPAEAARDVGRAMARNPVALFIPCHRVLAAGGRLGGFSAPGGAETKRRMLALEGVAAGEAAQRSLALRRRPSDVPDARP